MASTRGAAAAAEAGASRRRNTSKTRRFICKDCMRERRLALERGTLLRHRSREPVRTFLVTAVLAAAVVPAAHAADVAMVARDVPLGSRATQSAAAPMHFNMLGVHWI